MTTIPELTAILKQLTPQHQLEFQAWVLWRTKTDAWEHYKIAERPIGVAWKGLSPADQERVAARFTAYAAERMKEWQRDPTE
jgi:hypothetical protein